MDFLTADKAFSDDIAYCRSSANFPKNDLQTAEDDANRRNSMRKLFQHRSSTNVSKKSKKLILGQIKTV